MDMTLSPRLADLQGRVESFVAERIRPLEADPDSYDDHENIRLEWMYRSARQARLVDGASEVHKMVLSRFLMAEGGDFRAWPTA